MDDETAIKDLVRERVFALADEVDWMHLTIDERRRFYERWTVDPELGGLLREVMKPHRVRVYLKDSIMGEYARARRLTIQELLRALGVPCARITEEFIKPQAILCDGTRLYTLTSAKDWKISLINAFERSKDRPRVDMNVLYVVNHTTGRFVDHSYRSMIEDAGRRLGVEVDWVR